MQELFSQRLIICIQFKFKLVYLCFYFNFKKVLLRYLLIPTNRMSAEYPQWKHCIFES